MGLEELDRMSPEAREKYLEILRSIPIGRKLEITASFCDAMREMVISAIRSENPDASEMDILKELSMRVLPEDIRKKAYGW